MTRRNTIKIYIFCLMFLAIAASCKKMDTTYAGFIKDGPIIYPGKADTVLALPGNGRVALKWAVPFDGNITSYKVFWNFGSDSLALQGDKPTGNDSVRVSIDSLTEGTYNFVVYTYDKNGHRSVGEKTVAKAYGPIFASTIYNRPVRSFIKDPKTSSVQVTWVGLDVNCIGTEWTYTKTDGTSGSFFSPVGATSVISNCNVTKPVSYRSVFLPEPAAIDKFYTSYIPL